MSKQAKIAELGKELAAAHSCEMTLKKTLLAKVSELQNQVEAGTSFAGAIKELKSAEVALRVVNKLSVRLRKQLRAASDLPPDPETREEFLGRMHKQGMAWDEEKQHWAIPETTNEGNDRNVH